MCLRGYTTSLTLCSLLRLLCDSTHHSVLELVRIGTLWQKLVHPPLLVSTSSLLPSLLSFQLEYEHIASITDLTDSDTCTHSRTGSSH